MNYIEKPDTPFVVFQTIFSKLRKLDNDGCKSKKESILKRVDFSAMRCWYTSEMLSLVGCGGFNMLSVDQGNPTLFSDKEGQTWYISTWGMNSYKKAMTPNELKSHMDQLCACYNPTAGNATYAEYVSGGNVVVLSIISRRVLKTAFHHMRRKAMDGRDNCGYMCTDDVVRHCSQMGNRV